VHGSHASDTFEGAKTTPTQLLACQATAVGTQHSAAYHKTQREISNDRRIVQPQCSQRRPLTTPQR
jgi:hypothetical protein